MLLMPAPSDHSIAGNIAWLCLTILVLILSFALSWLILTPMDFAYQWLYGLIDIDQHIAKYGPENTVRHGFELTADAERFRLFSGIVSAIHQQGQGLDALVYHNPQGTALAKLLTHDEVVHLEDVAILIDRMKILVIASLILFMGVLTWIYLRFHQIPSFRSMLLTVFIFLAFAIALILIIGPYEVFYNLHVWVFPEEHKWFFYYEESLMSTMMKAPDLFAYIAILLLALAVPIFVFLMWLVRKMMLPKMHRNAAA